LAAVALFGGVAARGKDQGLQDLVTALLAPYADHIVVFGVGGAVLGSAHYWLGLLASAVGDTDDAIDHLSQAATAADQIESPYWEAQAQMDASRIISARARGNDVDEGAQLAVTAATTARRLNFGRVLR
jgi:hypothetical protein